MEMSASLAALLGRIKTAGAMEKLLDHLVAAGAGVAYERLAMYAGGTSIYKPGWKQYAFAAIPVVADVFLDVPLVHGFASGAVGALAAHLQLIRDLEAAAKSSSKAPTRFITVR